MNFVIDSTFYITILSSKMLKIINTWMIIIRIMLQQFFVSRYIIDFNILFNKNQSKKKRKKKNRNFCKKILKKFSSIYIIHIWHRIIQFHLFLISFIIIPRLSTKQDGHSLFSYHLFHVQFWNRMMLKQY